MAHVGSRKRSRSRSRSRSGRRGSEKRSKRSSKDASRNCSASRSQGHKAGSASGVEERSKHMAQRTSRSSSTSSSSSSSSSASSSSSSDGRKKRAKHKEKKRKKKKKKRKKKLKKRVKEKAVAVHQAEALPGPSLDQWHRSAGEDNDGPVLTDEQKSRIQAMKPMTKEEWDARQSVIRKVVDPETGRTRLIKGDGEVLEEIVTKERHREINKQATRGDGLAFQMRTGLLP